MNLFIETVVELILNCERVVRGKLPSHETETPIFHLREANDASVADLGVSNVMYGWIKAICVSRGSKEAEAGEVGLGNLFQTRRERREDLVRAENKAS
jgi:hypothetical protein